MSWMFLLLNTVVAAAISAAIPGVMFRGNVEEYKQKLDGLEGKYNGEIDRAKDVLRELQESLIAAQTTTEKVNDKYQQLEENLLLVGGFEELEKKVDGLRLQVLRSDGFLHEAEAEKERIESLRREAETSIVELEQLLKPMPRFEQELNELNSAISGCSKEAHQALEKVRAIVREANQDFTKRLDDALVKLKSSSRIKFRSRQEKGTGANYLAESPGWVMATIETIDERNSDGSSGKRGTICGYADTRKSSLSSRPRVKTSVDHRDNPQAVLSMPVKKGEYWSIDYCPISGKNRPRVEVYWVGLELQLGL